MIGDSPDCGGTASNLQRKPLQRKRDPFNRASFLRLVGLSKLDQRLLLTLQQSSIGLLHVVHFA